MRSINKFLLLILLSGLLSAAHAQPVIGVAKDENRLGREVTLDFYLENFGTESLINLAMSDDLDAVFGAGNYTLLTTPSLLDDPGTISLNSGFDGSLQTSLITTGSLAIGATAQIRIVIQVDQLVDMGAGLGVYSNQVTAMAEGDPSGTMAQDLSDDGTDPDPNGNGDPTDTGEDDPTAVIVDLSGDPTPGVAKDVSLNANQVTFDFFLENLGNRVLSDLSLPDNLDNVFGAGNYAVLSPPAFIDDPGTITLNLGFDGSSNTDLINAGTLGISDTAQIRLVIDVTTVSDQGNGFGVYANQVVFSGQSPAGIVESDLSDNGNNPDPNGNGDPNDVGENDPSEFTIGDEPQIGIAKDATVNGDQVTLDFYIENLGNVTLENLALTDNLDNVFGVGNYELNASPVFVDDPGTITLNAGFDGAASDVLISSGNLVAGDTAQIRVLVDMIRLTDQGLGLGSYSNQVTINAQANSGANTSDLSDAGTDPDSNGNGNPDEAGENDATGFTVNPRNGLGLAKTASVTRQIFATFRVNGAVMGNFGDIVRVQFFLENTGNTDINNLALTDDLNAVFGVGNFGTFIRLNDQFRLIEGSAANIQFNPNYDGALDPEILLPISSLPAGETARIQLEFAVITLTDQGQGLGIYLNSATLSGDSIAGGSANDVSDNGTVPDPNGNGDATEPGENDPTPIELGQAFGVALDITTVNNIVTFDYYLESFGTRDLVNLDLNHALDIVFGADNYTVSSAPSLIDDPGTINLNAAYDGMGEFALIASGSTLLAGDTAQIRTIVTVSNVAITSLGNAVGQLGSYIAQVTAAAETSSGLPLLDQSDNGTDPDPDGDGNPSFVGENDPTPFNIPIDSVVGVAKDANETGPQVTIDFYLENLGTLISTDLSLTDNLDLTFGAGNYSITTAPNLIDDPGTINLNGAYDGSADIQLLAAGSSLSVADTAQVQMVVVVNNVVDVGLGLGLYENQAIVMGTDPNNYQITDLSDDGTNPDENGDGNPGLAGLDNPPVPGEDDPTLISLGIPSIGIAKNATVNGTIITLDYYIDNLGTLPLDSITLADVLFTVFGFGDFATVEPAILVSGPASMTPQTNFDGTFATTIVFNGELDVGESAQIRFVLDVTNVTDQGNGFGVYTTQTTVTGQAPDDTLVIDLSDDGTISDPNGNGDAGDAGEDDPTLAIIGEEAVIGAALDAAVTGNQVTLNLVIENLGNVSLSMLDALENLDDVFGAGNYTINSLPAFVIDPGTITLNGGFNGSADPQLFGPASTLTAGTQAQIQWIVDVNNIELIDQSLTLGDFSDQVMISALAPMGSVASDVSNTGTNPDPNGDGDPGESGEQEPTIFTLQVSGIGVAKNAITVMGSSQLTLDFFIENLGNTTLSNVSMTDDLDAVFGAGNYLILDGPDLISIPRDLSLNQNFNGSADTQLIQSGDLEPNVVEQIRLTIDVTQFIDQGLGIGNYSNQVTVMAEDSSLSMLSDVSDEGTNPDANDNGFANDPDESDPTLIMIDIRPPPLFSKAFLLDPIIVGGISTLSFTIDNSTATRAATAMDFIDNLPAGLFVATPANVVNSCGGTLTAVSGSASINLTDGVVGPLSSCIISVDIVGTVAGDFVNTTGNLISSSGDSGTASDAITVNPPPVFSKSFSPNPNIVNGVSTLTFSIDNTPSTVNATALDFTDNLPVGLVIATPANTANTCTGGSLTATSGTSIVSYTGGVVSTGTVCAISVDVVATTSGDFVNTTGDLTSSLGNSGTAGDTLRVNPVPGFSKQFSPDLTFIGAIVTLTFNVDNSASTVDATGLDFVDNFPAGLVVASPSNVANTCTGGTLTAVAGSSVVSYTGGSVNAAASCALSVDVTPSNAGALVNTTGDLTSLLGNSGTASDTLNVDGPPGFAKAFSPSTIVLNGNSTLSFTIDNSANLATVTALDFTDNLPAGVIVAATPNASTTCVGGTLTAAAGSGVVSYTGGTVNTASSCTLQVDVTSGVSGQFVNVTGDLTSSIGNSGSATATLTTATPPAFSKSFSPDTIGIDGTSTLSFTIDNTFNLVAASGLDFADNLPAGITVATTPNANTDCGLGTLTATAGTNLISLAGGTAAISSICTVNVDVTGNVPGDYVNLTGDLTSDLGNSGTATATLTIATPLLFSKEFAPQLIPIDGISTLTFSIENNNLADANNLDFSDDLPAGLRLAANPNATTNCMGGTITATPGSTVLSYIGGTIAGSDTVCTVEVDVTGNTTGVYDNVSSVLTSTLGSSAPATDTLSIAPAPLFSVALDPEMILQGETSRLTYTIDNSGSTLGSGASPLDVNNLSLNSLLPMEITLSLDPIVSNSCGGSLTAVPRTSSITLTGGSVTAGTVCNIEINVTSEAPGTYQIDTGDLISSGGNSGNALITIVVGFSAIAVPVNNLWMLLLIAFVLSLVAMRKIQNQSVLR